MIISTSIRQEKYGGTIITYEMLTNFWLTYSLVYSVSICMLFILPSKFSSIDLTSSFSLVVYDFNRASLLCGRPLESAILLHGIIILNCWQCITYFTKRSVICGLICLQPLRICLHKIPTECSNRSNSATNGCRLNISIGETMFSYEDTCRWDC